MEGIGPHMLPALQLGEKLDLWTRESPLLYYLIGKMVKSTEISLEIAIMWINHNCKHTSPAYPGLFFYALRCLVRFEGCNNLQRE